MTDATEAASTSLPTASDTRIRLQARRTARRRANTMRRLHHHAVRTDDMAATRRFYEDLLGMPMVAALRESVDLGGGEKPFLHCFFEMADGGCLAFFQFLPDAFGPATKLPRHGVDHHLAMLVPGFEEIARLKAKFDALLYPNCGINHGFCYSHYVRDPNGMLVEFVVEPANELELCETAAASAHEELAKWQDQDYTPNHLARATMACPFPTSPAEDIAKVIACERHAEERR
ncbi:MAG TPA: VOC family protein [Stellaceae bacterium]|nr:VOC family protein [Stellaceae bacterium]